MLKFTPIQYPYDFIHYTKKKDYTLNLSSPKHTHLLLNPGIILCMRPANERQQYIVMLSPIGWVHTQNDPWNLMQEIISANTKAHYIKVSQVRPWLNVLINKPNNYVDWHASSTLHAGLASINHMGPECWLSTILPLFNRLNLCFDFSNWVDIFQITNS